MTGLELLPKANAARPDVPVIMINPYGGDAGDQTKSPGRRRRDTHDDFVLLRNEIDGRIARAA
jgi:hypothetical protein